MAYDVVTNIRLWKDRIKHLEKDNLVLSTGGVWSIKKLLALDYYLPAFKTICSPKNKFKEWYYVDPFCGSGLIKLDEDDKDLSGQRFPGSAIIGTFGASIENYTDCFLSDIHEESIEVLKIRLGKSQSLLKKKNYEPKTMSFDDAVDFIEKKLSFGRAFLVFIDPIGYKEVKWKLMERLLKKGVVDILFTFMTDMIALNVAGADKNLSHKGLNEFFGDDGWKNCKNGDELLQYYRSKIEGFGKKTYPIGIYKKGKTKLYDLILATRSTGGGNVLRNLQRIMDKTNTESIRTAFKVISGKQHQLFED